MNRKPRIAHLPLTLARNDDGYLAQCSLIQGAFAEGDTPTEALSNLLDVVRMIGAYRRERGESLLGGPVKEFSAREEISFTVPVEV